MAIENRPGPHGDEPALREAKSRCSCEPVRHDRSPAGRGRLRDVGGDRRRLSCRVERGMRCPRPSTEPTVLRCSAISTEETLGAKVFGSGSHDYKLNPPLPASVVEAFEERHGVSLPEDYRPLPHRDRQRRGRPVLRRPPVRQGRRRSGLGGRRPGRRPLASRSRTRPPGTCPSRSGTASPTRLPARRPRRKTGCGKPGTGCWRRTTGTRRSWTGRSRSATWAVPCGSGSSSTASSGGSSGTTSGRTTPGLAPVLGESGEPVTFADWYMAWLDDSLRDEVRRHARPTSLPGCEPGGGSGVGAAPGGTGSGAAALLTRGVVLVPEDLTLADWPERARQAGLTTIGIHHQNSPQAVIDWIRADAGQRFLGTCGSSGWRSSTSCTP